MIPDSIRNPTEKPAGAEAGTHVGLRSAASAAGLDNLPQIPALRFSWVRVLTLAALWTGWCVALFPIEHYDHVYPALEAARTLLGVSYLSEWVSNLDFGSLPGSAAFLAATALVALPATMASLAVRGRWQRRAGGWLAAPHGIRPAVLGGIGIHILVVQQFLGILMLEHVGVEPPEWISFFDDVLPDELLSWMIITYPYAISSVCGLAFAEFLACQYCLAENSTAEWRAVPPVINRSLNWRYCGAVRVAAVGAWTLLCSLALPFDVFGDGPLGAWQAWLLPEAVLAARNQLLFGLFSQTSFAINIGGAAAVTLCGFFSIGIVWLKAHGWALGHRLGLAPVLLGSSLWAVLATAGFWLPFLGLAFAWLAMLQSGQNQPRVLLAFDMGRVVFQAGLAWFALSWDRRQALRAHYLPKLPLPGGEEIVSPAPGVAIRVIASEHAA